MNVLSLPWSQGYAIVGDVLGERLSIYMGVFEYIDKYSRIIHTQNTVTCYDIGIGEFRLSIADVI